MLLSGNFSLKKEEDVSLWLSIKAVFLGITVSIFTPNRVGEFGGRVFCLEKANRIKAVLITILGNMGQLLATTIFGTLALVHYIHSYSGFLDGEADYWFFILVFIAAIVVSTLIALYLNAYWLSSFFMKFKFLRKYEEYSDVFSYYSTVGITVCHLFKLCSLRSFLFSVLYSFALFPGRYKFVRILNHEFVGVPNDFDYPNHCIDRDRS